MMNKSTLIRSMKKMDLFDIFIQFKKAFKGFNLNFKLI